MGAGEKVEKLCPFQGGVFAIPHKINPGAAQVTFISGPCLGGKCVMHGTEDEGCLLVRRSILVNLDKREEMFDEL